jgi:tryptophan-rich sensory protein
MSKIVRYIVFIGLVVGAGTLSGLSSGPGTSNGPISWYLSLEKPFFTPPAWVFGPAWTILYILIGIAGARIWERAPKSAAMKPSSPLTCSGRRPFSDCTIRNSGLWSSSACW